jgi:phage regulator Rha-like protein
MVPEIKKITSRILVLPGRPLCLLDRDVADIYGVTTKHLNRAMKRNKDRFPEEFCFQLMGEEWQKVQLLPSFKVPNWHLKDERGRHVKYLPFVYTQEGCNSLSFVLNTPKAIELSILIIKAFTYLERNGLVRSTDAPATPLLPNGWQMHCLIKIHGTEGAARILKDWWGIHPDGFKDKISPYEMAVIRKDNPNKLHRDQCILELAERGVGIELISGLSGMSKPTIYGIIKSMTIVRDIESRKALTGERHG